MHIGSGPGVVGLSGKHVNPLLPWRKVRIVPSLSMVTIVADALTLPGAAFMALWINFVSAAEGADDLAPASRGTASAAFACCMNMMASAAAIAPNLKIDFDMAFPFKLQLNIQQAISFKLV
jgi:hypothetical protein